jgi:hypothetical protein
LIDKKARQLRSANRSTVSQSIVEDTESVRQSESIGSLKDSQISTTAAVKDSKGVKNQKYVQQIQ